jgi:hypothetical protein
MIQNHFLLIRAVLYSLRNALGDDDGGGMHAGDVADRLVYTYMYLSVSTKTHLFATSHHDRHSSPIANQSPFLYSFVFGTPAV